MNLNNRPKLRVSLYKYDSTYGSFLTAFIDTAFKQGWTVDEISTVITETKDMEPLEGAGHLMQYALIVKLPKGVRIKKGKVISVPDKIKNVEPRQWAHKLFYK